jgi:hypothetical protein
MVNTFDPRTGSEAKAFIKAELDSIVANFEKSLRRCNKGAEILMMKADREYKHPKNSSLKQNCVMFTIFQLSSAVRSAPECK